MKNSDQRNLTGIEETRLRINGNNQEDIVVFGCGRSPLLAAAPSPKMMYTVISIIKEKKLAPRTSKTCFKRSELSQVDNTKGPRD